MLCTAAPASLVRGLERGLVAIFRKQLAAGAIAGVDALSQEAALAQAEASVTPLQKQLAQERDLITALSGNLPSDAVPETFTLEALHLPEDLPVSLPAHNRDRGPVNFLGARLHAQS